MDDVRAYNRKAWDQQVEIGNEWTVPASREEIEAARQGQWQVLLTENIFVPQDWFPPMIGLDVLCLASGGGQQGPVMAAAGANVTVYDNSPRQLSQDRKVAERDGLPLLTIEGDMRDLSIFPAERFDLVFHPVSNLFVPEVRPVWREAYRVLRPGGTLLAGFVNPIFFLFDFALHEKGVLQVRHKLPYSDLTSLSEQERLTFLGPEDPLEFGHTLEDQIGGQLEAGFVLTGFYEDRNRDMALGQYIASYIATRAIKPG